MAYNREEILKKSEALIKEHNMYFIEDIIALLPCAKPTFYEMFPVDSNELNYLKGLLEENRVNQKIKMRKKWGDSDNATLQMALMKLIGNNEELRRLSTQYVESDNNNKNTNQDITPISFVKSSNDKAE